MAIKIYRVSRFALPWATPATSRPRSPPPPHAGALLRSSNRRRKMIVARSAFLCCTLIAISVISVVGADSIRGCGGFVEATSKLIKSRKPSDGKLDYSHITVELQTVDGLVKDRTQCAPNGYYFIPVYDRGSFVIKIKGPEGWSWDPDSVPIVIDQSGCNSNADINFRLTGFTISGKVLGAVGGESCSLKGAGPAGVKIELLLPSEGVISSVMTTSSGEYSFINVIPGSYILRASHPNLKIDIKGSEEVVLGFGNVILDDIFFVPGYNIQGFVVAQGNPILGVHLYLYSDDVHKVNCPQGPVHDPWQKSSLCHAVSDADGKFIFSTVPCGSYKLVPYYKGENTVFDVSPSSVHVSVAHQHVTVLQKFQVTGFSIGGRVIDGNADGVDAVEIIVDGQVRSVTDSLGYYKLDQVTSRHYTISAKKNHYRFKSLEKFMVLPNMVSVPDIEATSYDICGIVSSITSGQKLKVALTHGPDNVKPQIKQTDEDGYFCFEVPAGEYRLSALAATPESASGLVFLPPFVDITVNSPLLNVEFSQAQVDIHGTVVCKDACGSSVHVSLSRLLNDGKQEKKTIDLSQENSDFVFAKVLPGKYRLEVKHGPLSTEDTWCWEHSAIDVDVGAEDVKGIIFIQKGYWINIDSTHEVDVAISKSGVSALTLPIKKGSQRICIESSGKHELHFVNSCILFESSPVIFDTLYNSSIYLKGDKYLLKGEIHIDPASLMEGRELLDNILVDILDRDHRIVGQDIARVILDDNDGTSGGVYKYSYWANLGDELLFVPQDLRNNTDKKFLFYPSTNRVLVNSDGCYATNPPLVGRLGLYIVGSVSPPISDVDIKIFASGNSGNSMLKKDDLALKTKTGKDGFFNGGPLYDDINYYVVASKHGYYLKPEGPYSFSCQKLSQISVTIHSREDSENLFPSVLLSLSGEDGYRNNSVTGTGGSFIFDSLFPGSFYLRPLLKEYSFSPSAQAIELGSGESKDIFFEATRVAYSAMGSVSLLSGQPKEDVSVEARSESSGYYEETVTDSSGNYRLRGLLPDTTYLVRVVDKESCEGTKIERASPEFVHIKVSSEDIRGLDFVVFDEPELTILSGHVEGNDLEKLQPHLTVEVRMASDPSKTLSVSPLPFSHYFQLRDLPKGRHLVQLRLALSSVYKFESEAIEVDLEKRSQIHVGPLKYTVEELRQKVELTPAPVFPLIAGVAVIALFIFMPRLKDVYHLAVGMTPFNSASNMKKETRRAIPKRRTY